MSLLPTQPTPYPDVNAVLDALLSGAQSVLGDRFVGMYLYGSLASGDFQPQRSDIDFLVVTADELPEEMVAELAAMHAGIGAGGSKWAAKLEGAYLPREALRRYDPADDAERPCLNDGRFYLARQGSDWVIQRHVLREQGVVVAGPNPWAWIDPVQPDDLRRAVLGVLREWWSPMLADPGRLQTAEYQAYAILTMCRALYTLKHGRLISKTAAARWAQAALGAEWAALIEGALAWRPGEPFDHLNETLAFIGYTLEHK